MFTTITHTINDKLRREDCHHSHPHTHMIIYNLRRRRRKYSKFFRKKVTQTTI